MFNLTDMGTENLTHTACSLENQMANAVQRQNGCWLREAYNYLGLEHVGTCTVLFFISTTGDTQSNKLALTYCDNADSWNWQQDCATGE